MSLLKKYTRKKHCMSACATIRREHVVGAGCGRLKFVAY